MKRIAIVPASGIGDALLMQICAANLQSIGYETVTFSKPMLSLVDWFPNSQFSAERDELSHFDAVILQYDNTAKAAAVRELPNVYNFYGDYNRDKHGSLRPGKDAVFDPSVSMADNIARATRELFPATLGTKNNGLIPLSSLTFRKYPKRVAIHTTSTSETKNWPHASFLTLRDKLAEAGWEPVFIPLFATLSDLASFLYESGSFIGNDSGPGHLASNLGLSTLTIGSSEKHLRFWRPDWHQGAIASPLPGQTISN